MTTMQSFLGNIKYLDVITKKNISFVNYIWNQRMFVQPFIGYTISDEIIPFKVQVLLRI